jgi:hypothetical protein
VASAHSLVAITCPACGVSTRCTTGWVRACRGAFCQGCTQLIALDGDRFATSCEAIDNAMQELDEAIGELRKPLSIPAGARRG